MTEPSPYFTQHHAVEPPAVNEREFRTAWRRRPQLEQLAIDEAISYATFRAGAEFRVLAEIAIIDQWPAKWIDDRGKGGFRVGALIARRMKALDRLRDIRANLGPWVFGLLERHLVDDLSWAELGRRYGVHGKTARAWTIAALAALATVTWQGGYRHARQGV